MNPPSDFSISQFPFPWKGGEPRVFAVDKEAMFPAGLRGIENSEFADIRYQGGGLTALLEAVAAAFDFPFGSLQATLEHLEDHSHEKPVVVVVRDADRLLADVGPAIIHLITSWEGFTHHAKGISAMYLVLETGPSAVTNSAFYPGGVVNWLGR